MVGPQRNYNASRDLTTPLSGIVRHPLLALATINLSTKFEVPKSTHYGVTKGDTNIENGVVWGS